MYFNYVAISHIENGHLLNYIVLSLNEWTRSQYPIHHITTLYLLTIASSVGLAGIDPTSKTEIHLKCPCQPIIFPNDHHTIEMCLDGGKAAAVMVG